jgi:hypothetical protein
MFPPVKLPRPDRLSALAATAVCLWSGVGGSASAEAQTPVPAGADEAERRGFEIAARADRSDQGFGSSEVSATMVLRNAAGQETSRRLRFRTLERISEEVGDKSLVIFETPRDVEGTALLSHAQILEPDDQWLYLPALKRVKRISSANKSGPFVGSEFAFEDFTSTELNKYTYRYQRETEVDGMTVDVVEFTPRYENSGYTRLIGHYDQQIHQARRIDYYDRKNTLLKTLTLSDYRDYDGIWRAHEFRMVNHQTGKETDIRYDEFDFSVAFRDRDFDKGVLNRIR